MLLSLKLMMLKTNILSLHRLDVNHMSDKASEAESVSKDLKILLECSRSRVRVIVVFI